MFRSTTTILLACIICCASAAEDSQSESTPEQPPIGIVSEDEVPDYLAPQNEHPEGAESAPAENELDDLLLYRINRTRVPVQPAGRERFLRQRSFLQSRRHHGHSRSGLHGRRSRPR